MRRLFLAAVLAAPLLAGAAPARLDDPTARAFIARQSRAWNAGDLAGYFALFTRDAKFSDQARARDGRIVPYGTSTLAEARAQARRALAAARVQETTAIGAITLSPDGRRADVAADVRTTLVAGGRTRRSCAERRQSLVLTPAGVRSTGQVDTIVRCR